MTLLFFSLIASALVSFGAVLGLVLGRVLASDEWREWVGSVRAHEARSRSLSRATGGRS